MTEAQINRAIADAVGFEAEFNSDLNAMNKAEELLTERQRRKYVEHIGLAVRDTVAKQGLDPRGMDMRDVIYFHRHATAAQCAESLLRALSLWRS